MIHSYLKQVFMFTLAMILLAATVSGQTGKIVGTITDEAGIPLPGTTIRVDRTTLGATSDQNGTFRLSSVPSGNQTLLITLLGFQRIEREVLVNSSGEVRVDITLEEDVLQL
ncbi:MAG: carboxypeptidase-like regulatory domain-containing protein, partial [Bacteroidota bacterium]